MKKVREKVTVFVFLKTGLTIQASGFLTMLKALANMLISKESSAKAYGKTTYYMAKLKYSILISLIFSENGQKISNMVKANKKWQMAPNIKDNSPTVVSMAKANFKYKTALFIKANSTKTRLKVMEPFTGPTVGNLQVPGKKT